MSAVPQSPVDPSPAQATPKINASSGSQAKTPTPKIKALGVSFYYGSFQALYNVTLEFACNRITALIGPSGCGKSTFLRNLNRINETLRDTRIEGEVTLDGENIFAQDVTEIRRRVGMVFQRPNPFPKSIFENIIYGPKVNGMVRRNNASELVEKSLRRAALWDEVKDKLHESAYALSGGQQQRLCIARALAVEPEVLLLDEPCSALDPIATARIEDVLIGLKQQCTIVIVTHNMQQAARVADTTGFFLLGKLIEHDKTDNIFKNPAKKETEDYITGRFG
jgi:phosphate transport system ATP-binding protein